jgi:6-phosphogluconolactonase
MVDTWIGDPPSLTRRLTDEIGRLAAAAATAERAFAIAVSGGSVATTFFPAWAAAAGLNWGATDIFWADERAVAPSDPDSNYALARALWLDPARVPADRVHRMPAEAPDLDGAAQTYADRLRRTLGPTPVLDLVLLGIGPDGHVASLFPGHALLGERVRLVAAVTDSPKPPPRRLTLTPPVLTAARTVAIGAFGAPKAAIVRDALENPASTLPAALIARAASRTVWLLDAAAASQLTPR